MDSYPMLIEKSDVFSLKKSIIDQINQILESASIAHQ